MVSQKEMKKGKILIMTMYGVIWILGLMLITFIVLYQEQKIENEQIKEVLNKEKRESFSAWIRDDHGRFSNYVVQKELTFYKNGEEIEIPCIFESFKSRAVTHKEIIELYLCGVLK